MQGEDFISPGGTTTAVVRYMLRFHFRSGKRHYDFANFRMPTFDGFENNTPAGGHTNLEPAAHQHR